MNWPCQLLLFVMRQQNRLRYKLKFQRWRTDGYEIAYLYSCSRNAGPTLVFLHGLGASKDQWGPQIYSLVDTYNCLFLDLPGEGESSFDSSHSYSAAAQVERLKVFLDAQRCKSVALIGSSIGACIACLYAATFPKDVSHLIAMAPAGLPTSNPSPTMIKFIESGRHPFAYRTVGEMQSFWNLAFTRPPRVPMFLAKALAKKGALRYSKIVKILEDFKVAGLYPLEVPLADIQALTLIVWGRDDQIFDISCMKKISTDLPQASICIIDGAGHVPYLERGEQTVTTIRQFIPGQQFSTTSE
ncbi:alpha/beta hydrolase [Pseudomonas syringae]|uniref:Alpha/beta hydrolase n=1 Tax=Pseudomonas syringae TaxID=317 RepID=A0A244EK47_PSESX|nr:alpha/beta hydrolase [Pseudomonas syringae]OUM04843.1 alpha/beta hydrolase [Pseudomonas syringae]